MQDYRDFTYNNEAFKGLPDFVKNIQEKHDMKYIPIIDAGIAQIDTDETYKEGKA